MFPFAAVASSSFSRVKEIRAAEARRQREELILIPSESICLPEAAAELGTVFGNIYAEGRPAPRLCPTPHATAGDAAGFDAWQRRLADGRFYRGCRFVDAVELFGEEAVAHAFALLPGSPPAEQLHVNLQALSGAAANLAVYSALLKPGDAVLGLNLCHGGHLSHGSEFNLSGKTYRAFHYGVDEKAPPAKRKLDYDQIREQARACRPRMIIGGSSAYPWDFDWRVLGEIAREVGAYLLADVSHIAGPIVAGLLHNPLPHADIVTFTTHKTLCGPRGAVVLTPRGELAAALDAAVFPGLQGGPHLNAVAGIARLFELLGSDRDSFVRLQKAILENARVFAEACAERGFTLEYGGTNTHLFLIDLKSFRSKNGDTLDGETASRLLENVGIVCNMNTLPGDRDASESSGLRLGTPWLTQRGVTPDQLRETAELIRRVLAETHAFSVYVPSGEERCRGRVAFEVLEEVRGRVRALAEALPYPPPTGEAAPMPVEEFPESAAGRAALLLRGDKSRRSIDQILTCDVGTLGKPGDAVRGLLLRPDGSVLDDVVVGFAGTAPVPGNESEERFLILPRVEKAREVVAWLRALSDAYILLDPDDLYRKVDGPFVVGNADRDDPQTAAALSALRRRAETATDRVAAPEKAPPGLVEPTKPFFVGQKAIRTRFSPPELKEYRPPAAEEGLKKTVLNELHRQAGGKMVPFAGWEMPVEYAAGGIFAEHQAVRTAAGLFDVSHMGVLEVSGSRAAAFLETVFTGCAPRLRPGEAHYSYMLDPHGVALDDLYVYRLEPEKFIVVVNAANAARDEDWLHAVNSGEYAIDLEDRAKRAPGPVRLRNLRDAGPDSLIDTALQGPLAAELLAESAASAADARTVRGLKLNEVRRLTLKLDDAGETPVIAAGTGYTGEERGFELFVHPDRGADLWRTLLARGRDRGVRAAGLGARDSLRTEAGLPLFGHDLEGPEALSLTECGYGFVCRFHTPYFVGRDAYIRRLSPRRKRVLRLKGKGRRSVRAGHLVLDGRGRFAGLVTSFAFVNPAFDYYVLAAGRGSFRPAPGDTVRAARLNLEQAARAAGCPDGEDPRRFLEAADTDLTEKFGAGKLVELTAQTRLPDKDEKRAWRELYSRR